jgi:tetratricopeptide (TPR) repeat protein
MNPPSNDVDRLGFPVPHRRDSRDRPIPPPRKRLGRGPYVLLGLAIFALFVFAVARTPWFAEMRQQLARSIAERAATKLLTGDADGAVTDLSRALFLAPEETKIREFRAYAYLEANDPQSALSDFNLLLADDPNWVRGHLGKSYALQCLSRYGEAIDAASRAVDISGGDDHNALNSRAYARAIAGMELEEGFADIERALDMGQMQNAAYLDTRGYLHFLLGRHQEALVDLDLAIAITEAERDQILAPAWRGHANSDWVEYQLKQYREHLAVMYHHRGEVHAALGNEQLSAADLRLGDQFGYDPDNGVF